MVFPVCRLYDFYMLCKSCVKNSTVVIGEFSFSSCVQDLKFTPLSNIIQLIASASLL